MNQYSLWKYLLVLAVLVVGLLYALPNLYGEDPAIQISSTREATVDNETQRQVEQILNDNDLPYQSIALDERGLLVRFSQTQAQLNAQDVLRDTLDTSYVVALNLAPSTPAWLRALNAAPMYLGLDLRGGVYFLMEVDQEAALQQAVERYVGDLRTQLRDERVRYVTVSDVDGSVEAKFSSEQELQEALDVIDDEFPNLILNDEQRGGEYYLVASLSEDEQSEIRAFAVQQNLTTLRNRINELGVAEPIIQQQGQDRIVVQLPGVQDTARAKDILGATATLEFHMVDETRSVEEAVEGRVPPGSSLYNQRGEGPVLLRNEVMLTGDYITDAASGIDQESGSPAVFITLDGQGARIFSDATEDNIGRAMGVVFIENKTETQTVDGEEQKVRTTTEEVINVAVIRDQLGKRFQITGLDSSTEARDLALLLRAGALAAPMEIIEERTVGPSLGAENIKTGFNSTLIGFALIVAFMTVYYRIFGLISSVTLGVNVVLLIAVLSMLQATLTLPGIAGVALTLGMAIDANVLIFERIREELRNGNSPQASIHAGFDRAFDTIVDSNLTTLIAGFALFMLGSGPVRGFAVVLCIGILTSMFSAVMVSRAIVNLTYGGRRKIARLSI